MSFALRHLLPELLFSKTKTTTNLYILYRSTNGSLGIQTHRSVSNRKARRLKETKKIMSMISGDHSLDSYEPIIAHGESVVDRKSVFQGHCAAVTRVEHVQIFLSKLKENKKIENAFHNMWAYRIDKSDPSARLGTKSASILQDCDDDGEQAAGGRLLSLLQILNVVNVMVVVTRWYGGIQLGPARFKHINNAARDSLVKGGFVKSGDEQTTSTTEAKPTGKGTGNKKSSATAGKKRSK